MKFVSKKRFDVANISLQGARHIDLNIPCQDSSISYINGHKCFVSVSDGHGGDAHYRSEIGSKLAVEIAKKVFLLRFAKNGVIKNIDNLERFNLDLANDIYFLWTKEIEAHFSENPYENDEKFLALSEKDKNRVKKDFKVLYGCTLICAYSTDTYFYIFKLGDGDVVVIDQKGEVMSIPELEDESNVLNKTCSLCSEDFNKHIRFAFRQGKETKPRGIFLFSDGVINSFGNPDMLGKFAQNLLKSFKNKDKKPTIRDLETALNKFSASSCGDDVSCAYIINRDKVKKS